MQHRWCQSFCEPRMVVDEERLLQENLKSFWTWLEIVSAAKGGHKELFNIFVCWYTIMIQNLFNFTANFVAVGVWNLQNKT